MQKSVVACVRQLKLMKDKFSKHVYWQEYVSVCICFLHGCSAHSLSVSFGKTGLRCLSDKGTVNPLYSAEL